MSPSSVDQLASAAEQLLGPSSVARDPATLTTYSYDAFLEKAMPDLVVVPQAVEQIAPLVKAAWRYGVPFIARGAGTGYCGGSVPRHGGMIIVLTQLRGVEIDETRGVAVAEPGAVTIDLQRQALARGWRYVPDPSSYTVCTIGGNIATNAGGSHCLAHGNTSHYVLGIDLVTPRGDVVRLGGPGRHNDRLDVRGIVTGAEGTLGVVQRAWLRLIKPPEYVKTVLVSFEGTEGAMSTLLQCFREALIPAAMDMIASPLIPDGKGGVTSGGKSILFIDVEGFEEEVVAIIDDLETIVRDHGGRTEVLERETLTARRLAITIENWTFLRSTTSTTRYFLFDAGVPRSRLATAITAMRDAAARRQVTLGNSFHAGDGNIHPAPFFTLKNDGVAKALTLWHDIHEEVQAVGGTISGEHGVGLEKVGFMAMYYGGGPLAVMQRIREGIDPLGLANPGKLIPMAPEERDVEPTRPSTVGELEVNDLDGIVCAPAGTTLAALKQAVAGSRYELAWVPVGVPDSATIGSVVELGLCGLRDARTAARDVLLGGVVRLPTGRMMPFGGRISKDVGGYELRKLIFGSRNQLGRVEHAVIKLAPRPTQAAAYEATFLSLDSAVDFLGEAALCALPWSYAVLVGGARALREGLRIDLVRGDLERHRAHLVTWARSRGVEVRSVEVEQAEQRLVAHVIPPDGHHLRRKSGIAGDLRAELKSLHEADRPFCALAFVDAVVFASPEPDPPSTPSPELAALEEAVVAAFAESVRSASQELGS